MYTLPFSYSNSYLFQLNFSLVFHDEEVDRKVYTVCYHQEIINIDKTKKKRYSGERLNSCHSLLH